MLLLRYVTKSVCPYLLLTLSSCYKLELFTLMSNCFCFLTSDGTLLLILLRNLQSCGQLKPQEGSVGKTLLPIADIMQCS